MIILLFFIRSKTSTQKTKTKNPSSDFCRVWFFRSDRSRSTVRVNRRAQLCMCARRPTARVDRAPYSALCLFGSTGRSTLVPQQSYFWLLMVDRPGRPVGVIFSDRLQQLYFLTDFFIGFSPQRICEAVFKSFPTPINRRSFQHDKITITSIENHIFTKFASFPLEKISLKSQNFHTPIWSLYLYFSLDFALHNPKILHLHIGYRIVLSLSLIHIWRCRRSTLCRSRWSPYH